MTNWFYSTTSTNSTSIFPSTTTNILILGSIGLDSTTHLIFLNASTFMSNHTSDYVIELTVKNVFLAIFLITLGLSTILGNTFVLLAIFIDFHLRSPTHYLMGSLAVADLLLGLRSFFSIFEILLFKGA